MSDPYCPKRSDIVWLTFTPQAGHEQAGHRPALVLSPERYNRKVGLALACPITSQVKGYPFEVPIPPGLEVSGVVLADQVKSLDWKARKASGQRPDHVSVIREEKSGMAEKRPTNVDQWLERETPRTRKALESASRYFDVNDNLTVNTLEAVYGQKAALAPCWDNAALLTRLVTSI